VGGVASGNFIVLKNMEVCVDITIPFSIRTLDFGIKGGEKLSEILPPSCENEG